MTTFLVLIALLLDGIVRADGAGCNGILKMEELSATMNLAKPLDTINNNISYVKIGGNKAFCVESEENFNIMVKFGDIKRVTNLQVQGFNLNDSNMILYAFTLEFSFDNVDWYKYNDDSTKFNPSYFLLESKTAKNGNNIIDNDLDGVGRYVKIIPVWPQTIDKKPFCIRFQFQGCDQVPPPALKLEKEVTVKINTPFNLSCLANGMIKMFITWKGYPETQRRNSDNEYLNGYTLSTDLTINITFDDLKSFDCEQFSTYALCKKYYSCKSYYFFNKKAKDEMKQIVKIKIEFPNQITNFEKVVGSDVELKWTKPDLGDIPSSFLQYQLNCNLNGRQTVDTLDINLVSKQIKNLPVYIPCECSLSVVMDTNVKDIPFKLNQDSTVLKFKSKSLRPNVKPIITASAISPDTIEITFITNIVDPNQGKIKGHRIEAAMISYGNRSIMEKKLYEKAQYSKYTERSNQNKVVMNDVKPWARYNVSVTAYNEDQLYSNVSFKYVTTPEGTPAIGPNIVLYSPTPHSISINIDLKSFPTIKRNGKITHYKILVKPGNNERIFDTNTYEITGLLPNTEYEFKCKASTKFGYGPFGEVLRAKTTEGKPSAPRNVRVERSEYPRTLLISWSKPLHSNGQIKQYEIQYTRKDGEVKSRKKSPDQITNVEVNIEVPVENIVSVIVRAFTQGGDGDWSQTVDVNPNKRESDTSSGDTLTLTLFIALFALLIILFIASFCGCYLYYKRSFKKFSSQKAALIYDYDSDTALRSPRRKLSSYESYPRSSGNDPFDGDIELSSLIGEMKHNRNSMGSADVSLETAHEPIPKEDFFNYINNVKKNDYEALVIEFKELPYRKRFSWHIAEKPENQQKNRYVNVYAYDHSRVVLKHECKRKASDYINATHLAGFNYLQDSTYRYISTQGPLPTTYNDFWHMVWQENVFVIAMVTNLKENDHEKCNQYWPNSGHMKYGGLIVTLDKIDKTADYVTRTFKVEKIVTREIRIVRQFHFVSWPDHGVPEYPTAILSLRRRMRHYVDDSRPILVHCSAGIGRSGCFILIDAMLEQIDQEGTVDVYNYLKYLRTRRVNMVQNVDQYIFAYNAIVEYITFGNTEILVNELDKKTRDLSRGRGMTDQFALITQNTDRSNPSNLYKVLLLQGKFLDAYFVDGYKQQDAFIITKGPSERNIADFWRMVLERQSHTIVMLNKLQETSQEYLRYWPDVEGQTSYGDITVLMNSQVANANIITRKIKVITNKSRCEVHHFQYVDWPDADVPNSRAYSNICTLMQAVEKSQQTLGNGPIIVHAGNDYGRSGTFIAIYNSTERLKVEQIIDVVQCVRTIRIAQPLAVDNVVQFQFVYNMLRTYLEGFENYCNYRDYNTNCRSPLSSTSTM